MKKTLKILLVSMLIISLLLPVVGCGKKDPGDDNEQKKLIMGTNAAFPPFEFEDGGEYKGIDVEFAKAIAAELGYELEIKNLEFDTLLNALNAKTVDFVAAGMTVTPDREKEVTFSMKYYTAKQSLIVKENSDISTLDNLVGKKIGVQAGTTGNYLAEDIEGAKDNNLITGFNSGADAVAALLNGQVDAVIIDNLPAKEYKNKNQGIVLVENLFEDEEYAMAFRKSDTELLEKFNNAMKKLIDNGEFQKIVDKYMLDK